MGLANTLHVSAQYGKYNEGFDFIDQLKLFLEKFHFNNVFQLWIFERLPQADRRRCVSTAAISKTCYRIHQGCRETQGYCYGSGNVAGKVLVFHVIVADRNIQRIKYRPKEYKMTILWRLFIVDETLIIPVYTKSVKNSQKLLNLFKIS